jgi:hypothetical protein
MYTGIPSGIIGQVISRKIVVHFDPHVAHDIGIVATMIKGQETGKGFVKRRGA